MEKRTRICCFNVDDDIKSFLSESFNMYDGSIGKLIDVSRNRAGGSTGLLLNHNFPPNLQEYEIFIIELNDDTIIPYDKSQHISKNIDNGKSSIFLSHYPSTIFNPQPVCLKLFSLNLKESNFRRPVIKIIFQTQKKTIPYCIDHSYEYKKEEFECSTYECSRDLSAETLCGKEIDICNNRIAHTLFDNIVDKCIYLQTFYGAILSDEQHQTKYNPDFTPLLKTKNDEIVSYLWKSEKEIVFMLPQLKGKAELLKILFNEILYKDFSEYFPYNNLNAWKSNPQYFLPNMNNLLNEKDLIRKKYEDDEKAINQKIEENNNKFSFLHDLLTETGDNLINATIKFFKWLGLTKVLDKDTTVENGLFEEDIQIDLNEKGILIIEVKGINGTSTDAECSQISKIRRRREKERQKWDVSALYIANNERKIEPLKRTLPPFNETQINDAENDDRGLAYTWQLFTLYFNIENGVISKEEAIDRFLKHGLLNFRPRIIEIGKPYKYYHHNTVACVELHDCEIQVNDDILYEQNGFYHSVKIEEIQLERQSLNNISDGKVGIKLSKAVPQNISLFKKAIK